MAVQYVRQTDSNLQCCTSDRQTAFTNFWFFRLTSPNRWWQFWSPIFQFTELTIGLSLQISVLLGVLKTNIWNCRAQCSLAIFRLAATMWHYWNMPKELHLPLVLSFKWYLQLYTEIGMWLWFVWKKFFMFQGPNIIIHQPDSVLESMNEWCIVHHGQVGIVLSVTLHQRTMYHHYVATPISVLHILVAYSYPIFT